MKKITKQIIAISIGFVLVCGGVVGVNTFISYIISDNGDYGREPQPKPNDKNKPSRPDDDNGYNHDKNHPFKIYSDESDCFSSSPINDVTLIFKLV